MRTWPGLYDMLPDPAFFMGAERAFRASEWPPGFTPDPKLLDLASHTRHLVSTSPLFTIPCAQLLSLRFATVDGYAAGPITPGPRLAPGDGTVAARTASFGNVPVYRVDSPHTLLPVDPKAIDGVLELAQTGQTRLPLVTPDQLQGPLSMREPTLEEISAAWARARMEDVSRGLFPLQDLCWLLAPKDWC
jgi:hypothetical protein